MPGESHGQRNLVGYSPWGRKESDTTEQLHSLKFNFEKKYRTERKVFQILANGQIKKEILFFLRMNLEVLVHFFKFFWTMVK